MKSSVGLIIGLSVGFVIGSLLAAGAVLFCLYFYSRRRGGKWKIRTTSGLPFRDNVVDASSTLSNSTSAQGSPKDNIKKKDLVSFSGALKYSYKDLKKATGNFTTIIGEGAFGKVYDASLPSGERFAVKELSEGSKQGEQEFQTEVMLLGRLHHRNLVNLMGYCSEKGKKMLVYSYMSNGSLASHLYNGHKPLGWNMRICIALDVAKGMEYLHDGANPPVVHRDIKSSNILLDDSMGARVSDFGLSKEEMGKQKVTKIRGTYGYLDPEYMLTKKFNKKSDVYSFGVLLFELITARNPQQGLMEYVELASMNSEEAGWEEIVDPHLDGNYDVCELNELAALALSCVDSLPKKRPTMRQIVLVLSNMDQRMKYHCHHRHHREFSLTTLDSENTEPDANNEIAISVNNHQIQIHSC